MARQAADDPVVEAGGDAGKEAAGRLRRRQLADLHDAAGAAQDPAVGDEIAGGIEQPGPCPRRFGEAAHHLAAELRDQFLALGDRIDDGALAECRGENFALRLQRLQLRVDQARFVFSEEEQADAEQRQGKNVDGENAQGEG